MRHMIPGGYRYLPLEEPEAPAATSIQNNSSLSQGLSGSRVGTLGSVSGDPPAASTGKRTEIMMHLFCQVPGRWQCRASDSPKISLLVRKCVLPRPLEIRRITTVVPQRDRSTASFGSHRYGNGLRSNREIVGRSRLIQNDSGLPQGPAVAPPGKLLMRQNRLRPAVPTAMIGAVPGREPMPGMRRRDVVALLGGAAVMWPVAARAQQARKVYRIGILETVSASQNTGNLDALLRGLRELGYVEGQNLSIEYSSADGIAERFPELAWELVRLNVDLIVTRGTPAAQAAKMLASRNQL